MYIVIVFPFIGCYNATPSSHGPYGRQMVAISVRQLNAIHMASGVLAGAGYAIPSRTVPSVYTKGSLKGNKTCFV